MASRLAHKQPTAPSSGPPPPALAPADRDALAAEHMPFVRAIAGKIKRTVAKEIEFDDLVEYGMIGLLEAAARFDPRQGVQFPTFAYYRIRGAIYDGLRGMGWMSRSAYAKARFEERSNALMADWPQQLGQLQKTRSSGPQGTYQQAVATLAHAVGGMAAVYITSLDAATAARLVDVSQLPADETLDLAQARQRVRSSLRKLEPQEQKLLELYYYRDLTLQEVGQALGLSKSWTSRLHARTIDKLQRLLRTDP